MGNRCTQRQMDLMNQLRKLWAQHVYWTRFFIISTAADLGDLEPVTRRLLQNPGDFAQLFALFYGPQKADRFKNLLTEHLMIAAELVNAAKKQEADQVMDARRRWYRNADEIAQFLATINPYWNEAKWKQMLYSHLEMTEQEAVLRLGGKYQADVELFDAIEREALEMADYMFCGIVRQFRFG